MSEHQPELTHVGGPRIGELFAGYGGPCETGDCPGDGRYAPPGRGHSDDCTEAYRAKMTTPPAGGEGRG